MDLFDPMPMPSEDESNSEYNGSKNSLDSSIKSDPSKDYLYSS